MYQEGYEIISEVDMRHGSGGLWSGVAITGINCRCGRYFDVDLDFIEWNCPHCGRIYKLTVENEPEERA